MIKEFFRFIWKRKLWWMMPIFLVLFLLSALIVLSEGSIIAPFIYTLF